MENVGYAEPSGDLGLKVIRGPRLSVVPRNYSVADITSDVLPNRSQSPEVRAYKTKNLPNTLRGLRKIRLADRKNISTMIGILELLVIRRDGSELNLGIVSTRVVTTAGVNFIRDAFLNSTELENMKYHGFGTGTTNEATSDTTLVTELTTEYASDNTRPTGSQVSGGTGAYQTVATLSPDSGGTLAITEHGIFSQAANSGGTLLDRSKFAAVNLVASADSLQATYTITFSAGG